MTSVLGFAHSINITNTSSGCFIESGTRAHCIFIKRVLVVLYASIVPSARMVKHLKNQEYAGSIVIPPTRSICTNISVYPMSTCNLIPGIGIIVKKVLLAPTNHSNFITRKAFWVECKWSKETSTRILVRKIFIIKVFLDAINRSYLSTRKTVCEKIKVGRTAVQSGGSRHSVRHLSSLISGHQSLLRAISSRSASLHYLNFIYRFLSTKFNFTISRQLIGLYNSYSINNFLTVSAIWSTGGGLLVCLSTLLRPTAHNLRSDYG